MEIFLVGGAVRDALLHRKIKERDYVVVGATEKEMLALGYKQVGKDFPVFLHPDTKEEYALARTERKTGAGYTGFSFDANKAVTLEEDLGRRDLTINAIAQSKEGKLIDPYDGVKDIQRKVLKHISNAFSEDPVRILRLARFAARFPEFIVADDTLQLCNLMARNGEVDALVPERVFKELERALGETTPTRFFDVIFQAGCVEILFPDVDFSRLLTYLNQLVAVSPNPLIRFAAFALATNDHTALKNFCTRYCVPKEFQYLVLSLNQHLPSLSTLQGKAEKILTLLLSLDVIRRPQRFETWLLAANALVEPESSQVLIQLEKAATAISDVSLSKEFLKNHQGPEIAKALFEKRLETLRKLSL
jgi:tRNA nucleotidyltransferase (CCA-adding enzyme)